MPLWNSLLQDGDALPTDTEWAFRRGMEKVEPKGIQVDADSSKVQLVVRALEIRALPKWKSLPVHDSSAKNVSQQMITKT